jgi:hypothetical protein
MSTFGQRFFYKNRDVTFSLRGTSEVALATIGQDVDATAFLNAAGITDLTITTAINGLVTDLKRDGIWGNMIAIYPFVGGTASTHKFNLKNPADTNAAFRLTFDGGGWVHNSNGITADGTGSYANTYFVPSADGFLTGSASMGLYSRTSEATTGVDMGCTLVTLDLPRETELVIRRTIPSTIATNQFINGLPVDNGTKISGEGGDPATVIVNLDGNGFYQIGRNGTTRVWVKNDTILRKDSTPTFPRPNLQLVIGAMRLISGNIGRHSARNYAYGFMGKSLTDTQFENHNLAVQRFQTILGRKV